MKTTVNGEGGATFSKTPAEQVLEEIYEIECSIEAASYGSSREAVVKAAEQHKDRAWRVHQLEKKVERAVEENQSTTDEKEKLNAAYQKLKDISEKKTHCLETMLQISAMQQMCSNLAQHFDSNATEMVDLGEKDIQKLGDNIRGFMASAAQDCVFAVRDNWDSIVKYVTCIDTHLKNASGYQQFFHEVEESSVWLHEDLKRIHESFAFNTVKGDYQDGERLMQEIHDVILSLRQWEMKTNFIWDKAVKVVPVHYRTNGIPEPIPARAIMDYSNSEFKVRTEEDLILLENKDAHMWKVKNARDEEGVVPSLAIVIPGPTKEAIDAAVQMRLRLLATWTNALKVIGRKLILFMLMVFKPDYSEDEITTMRSIQMMDRQELMGTLDYIEDTLKSHWGDHEGFHNLQERILMLRMILEDAEDNPELNEELFKSLIVQITTLKELMNRYQDLWQDWEKYKTTLESSQAPELMLIVDKWEQLKYVSRDQFAKMWQHELPFTEDEKSLLRIQALKHRKAIEGYEEGALFDHLDGEEFDSFSEDYENLDSSIVSSTAYGTVTASNNIGGIYGAAITEELDSIDDGIFSEGVEESAFGFEEHHARGMSSEGSEFGYATETKTAQTEQLSKAEVEENKRFVIKSVTDTRSDEDISLADAIDAGIIKADEGVYLDLKTDKSVPIPEAMNAGLIKVAFTTVKRGKEKKSSIGIITVKTERVPIRPYVINTVLDTLKNESVSQKEGIARGILNENLGAFRNLKTKQEISLAAASEQGLANIEFTGPQPEPEVITRIYAVRAVVDRKQRKIIGFQEAVSRGIINKESGAYLDTNTHQTMYVGDAIMRGFLKARLLDHAKSKSMDIDPRNRVVIDATAKIRKKLVNPLTFINVLKRQASEHQRQKAQAKS